MKCDECTCTYESCSEKMDGSLCMYEKLDDNIKSQKERDQLEA